MRKSNVHADRIPLLPVEDQEVKSNGIWLNSEKSTCKICKALSFFFFFNLGVSKVTSKIISCLDFPEEIHRAFLQTNLTKLFMIKETSRLKLYTLSSICF